MDELDIVSVEERLSRIINSLKEEFILDDFYDYYNIKPECLFFLTPQENLVSRRQNLLPYGKKFFTFNFNYSFDHIISSNETTYILMKINDNYYFYAGFSHTSFNGICGKNTVELEFAVKKQLTFTNDKDKYFIEQPGSLTKSART